MLRDHVVPLYLTLFPLFSISLSLQHLSIYLSIIYLSSIDQSKHNWPNHIKNNNNNKPTLARTRAWTVKKDASLKSVKAKCLSSGFRDWGYQTRYRDEYVQTCSMDSTSSPCFAPLLLDSNHTVTFLCNIPPFPFCSTI